MNIKAIIKTLTPSLELFSILGIIFIIVLIWGTISAVAIVINYVLVALFGEILAYKIILTLIAGWWIWYLIISPLYGRYKRISREIDNCDG